MVEEAKSVWALVVVAAAVVQSSCAVESWAVGQPYGPLDCPFSAALVGAAVVAQVIVVAPVVLLGSCAVDWEAVPCCEPPTPSFGP